MKETNKLEYIAASEGKILILLNGQEVGSISGGENGVDSKLFWNIATGNTEAPKPEFSYWLRDLRAVPECINSAPLTTINQAKALAEYHFLNQ